MKCPNCGTEMENIPSTIKVGNNIIGDPNVELFRCPKCKRIHVEGLTKWFVVIVQSLIEVMEHVERPAK